MTKYRLNVNPDVEHELTENEVADLKAMGFSVEEIGGVADKDQGEARGRARTSEKGA